MKDKKYHTIGDHICYTGKYRGAANSICYLQYRVPKNTPVVSHSGSNYDYLTIIIDYHKLADEFKKQCI